MQSGGAKGALGAVGQAVQLTVSGYETAAFQLAGTFVGTATFERTVDGANWLPFTVTDIPGGTAVTTGTAPIILSGNCAGMLAVRARCTAWTSGSIGVTMRAS